MSKVTLVTGGAGYIGSHTVLALADQNMPVVVVDNLVTGRREAVPPSVPFYLGNVSDGGLFQRIASDHNIDTVVHFAGSISVPESVIDPLKYYENNAYESMRLIKNAISAGVNSIIFSSTAAVYGDVRVALVDEDFGKNPINPYGRSKLIVESMLADAASANPELRFIVMRYFNVAGADPLLRSGLLNKEATNLIKVAIDVHRGRRPHLEIFGSDYPTADGSCVRDFIHVSDLASAHVDAIRYLRDGGRSEFLNCGYGRGISVLEVVRAIERLTGGALAHTLAPRRPGDPAAVVADPRRIHQILQWRPKLQSLDDILMTAMNWDKQYYGAS